MTNNNFELRLNLVPETALSFFLAVALARPSKFGVCANNQKQWIVHLALCRNYTGRKERDSILEVLIEAHSNFKSM